MKHAIFGLLFGLLACQSPATPETSPEASASPSSLVEQATVTTVEVAPSTQTIPTPEPTIVAPATGFSPELNAPTGLKTLNQEASNITIGWEAEPEAKAYRIYVNGQLKGVDIEQTQFLLTQLTQGQRYIFEVSSINGQNQESEKSAPLTVDLL